MRVIRLNTVQFIIAKLEAYFPANILVHNVCRIPLMWYCSFMLGVLKPISPINVHKIGFIFFFWWSLYHLYKTFSFFLCFADRASQSNLRNWPIMHNLLFFLISLLHSSTCFEDLCSSPGGQNCVIQHLVSSYSVGGRLVRRLTCAPVGHLQSVTIPDAV